MAKFVFNEAMKIRRKTIIELSKLLEQDELKLKLPKLPKSILGKKKNRYRTSVYHEREVLSQRIKGYLGLDYSKSKDIELYELLDQLDEILSGESELLANKNYLNIIEEACDTCPTKKYYITDGCRSCVAKSCENVCPKNAITRENGRMKIDEEKCVNCGLCASVCNYNAIIVQERPCERACSLNAIKADKDSPNIDKEKCVNCGNCYRECPFGAIETPSQLLQLQTALNKKEKVIAIFAPSIAGQFGMKVNSLQIKETLKKIGFESSISAASGADEVAIEEAKLVDKSEELITTSCCPAFVECIKKHYSEYEENISHEYSPMSFLANKLKEKYKATKIAFIGPCIAKKFEADNIGFVDYVITFEELGALFISKQIEPSQLLGEEIEGSDFGWNFAQNGGVSAAVEHFSNKELKILKMNGLEEAKKTFLTLKREKYDLLEGMACSGGCIGGPGIIVNPNLAKAKLKTPKK